MSNYGKVRTMSMVKYASRRMFQRGFNDRRAGLPIDESIRSVNDQWTYERGRLFATIYSGPLRVGRQINLDAMLPLAAALSDKTII